MQQNEVTETEPTMNDEQLEAYWKSKIAEAKRHLKQCSKNDLIRTVVQLQIKCYQMETYIQNNIQGDTNESNDSNSDSVSES